MARARDDDREPRRGGAVPPAGEPTRVFTVGHSTRALPQFLALLAAHGIGCLVDVRRHPGSRRHPHFSRAPLEAALRAAGIDYAHAPDLGGRRTPRPDSHNTAVSDEALRGYADHMETREFAAALARLVERAATCRTAVMCAEADWTRCHRALLSDRLEVSGVTVLHIRDAAAPVRHTWTRAARIVDGELSYRAPQQGELGLG